MQLRETNRNKSIGKRKKLYLGKRMLLYWRTKRDGASKISRNTFEEVRDINFYVGRAKNTAHQIQICRSISALK